MADQLKLAVSGAPLPTGWQGTPQEFFEAILERMTVLFPTGQTSFVISATEPSTNLGPWLKNGTQWFVWDETTKRYVPLDISASLKLISISETAPTDSSLIWLQIKGTRFVRWNVLLGDVWQPLTNRGTTAQRPTDPVEYERYEDTDIACEIVWYGGMWHTVSGVPGDIKFVSWATLADALTHNPGWAEFGTFFASDTARGRTLVPAHKDAGLTPAATFAPGVGITARAAGDEYGEETHVLSAAEAAANPHQHLIGSRDDTGSNNADFAVIDPQAFASAATRLGKLRVLGEGTGNGFIGSDIANGDLISSNPITSGTPTPNTGHNTIQPSKALWALVKL